MDIEKQVDYWRSGADEDMAAADSLLEKKHARHALFFAHLAVEKTLKALVVKVTGDLAPRIHDLVRLADIAEVELSAERRETLGRLRRYCLEGRYPESLRAAPTLREAESGLREAREVMQWLRSPLN